MVFFIRRILFKFAGDVKIMGLGFEFQKKEYIFTSLYTRLPYSKNPLNIGQFNSSCISFD
jgi:hypothetical protein